MYTRKYPAATISRMSIASMKYLLVVTASVFLSMSLRVFFQLSSPIKGFDSCWVYIFMVSFARGLLYGGLFC